VYASPGPAAEFPKAPGLTKYVADFIVNTKYEDIPPDVLDLGKKSILDGFGLALAGSGSSMGPLVRQYVQSLGLGDVKASIIGTGMKAHTRFAAFANGVSIHADDYDDTQLAAAKDRIYGLLTHPSVGVLPPTFAICELDGEPGKTSCWLTTSAWKSNARLPRPSRRATMTKVFIPPARADRSAAPRLARGCGG